MTKIILVFLVVAGWFALSQAFFPQVWNPLWAIPQTTYSVSAGLLILFGLTYLTFSNVK